MDAKTRWIFTIELEKWCDISLGGYFLDGAMTNKGIQQSLKLLFDNNVFTAEEFSEELKKHYDIQILPGYLKRYSIGAFEELRVIVGLRGGKS